MICSVRDWPRNEYETRMAVGMAASRRAAGVFSLARISRQGISRTAEFSRVPSSIEAVICAIISS